MTSPILNGKLMIPCEEILCEASWIPFYFGYKRCQLGFLQTKTGCITCFYYGLDWLLTRKNLKPAVYGLEQIIHGSVNVGTGLYEAIPGIGAAMWCARKVISVARAKMGLTFEKDSPNNKTRSLRIFPYYSEVAQKINVIFD